jgi:hypothetical protein
LVQAGQILQRESIRKLWLDNTFAMCMLQCVLFRLKLVLKLSASKCNCITVNSVPVISIDLPWRAFSTTTKCLRKSITWGNNMQVRYDQIGLWTTPKQGGRRHPGASPFYKPYILGIPHLWKPQVWFNQCNPASYAKVWVCQNS